ncbi:MAG: DMT family transporter [Rhodospirillales bacterium]|nr:DMT family transporter [Rhodospirillales bacterium]
MDKERQFGTGDAFMLAAVGAWGVNFPIAKTVLGEMQPEVFSATRYLAASFFIFLILIVRRERFSINLHEGIQLIGLGLLGITIFQGCWSFGLAMTQASKASVLIATTPIFGAIYAGFTGKWPSPKAWFGIGLSMVGVVLLVNNSFTQLNIGGGSLNGDLLILLGAIIWAIYTAASGPMIMKRGVLVVMAWGMLFGSLILMIFAYPGIMAQDWTAISPVAWASWSFSTIIGAAFAFVWYYQGFARLGITRAMVYTYLIPVVAVVTSVAFFGETLSFIQVGGAIIVLLGISLSRAN